MLRQKNSYGRSGSVITLAVFATLLLIAATASASSDMTKPISGSITNPCTTPNDVVSYQGQDHMITNNTVTPNGVNVNFMDQITGNGVGTSGLKYNVGMAMKFNAKVPSGPMTTRFRIKINSNGPADNFFVTSVVHVNSDGSTGPTTFESDCRG